MVTDENGRTGLVQGTVQRQEAADVLRAYTTWLVRWRRWADEERATRPRRDLYDQLAPIVRKLAQQDDTYELVLGVGLLTWVTSKGERVFRHLITTRVNTVIDRVTARLTIALSPEAPARLEDRDFLDAEDGYVRERIIRVQEQLAADTPHPLSEEMGALLGRWQSFAMDRPIRYDPVWEPPAIVETTPQLVFAPALLLRERDRNAWVEFYDRIAESLAGPDAASPLGLAQLLFALEQDERLAWTTGRSTTTDRLLGEEPLFPLETNPQQRAVLDRLQHDTAVVVQGPPGTGKTHTIANLISALLAVGQRVLVTSQKDQALKVLREKLPEPVRDLCLLLTDVRRGGSEELERSVSNLSDRTVSSDANQIRRRIDRLDQQRAELRSRSAKLTEDIRKLREAETYRHVEGEVAPGYDGTLADIVEAVMAARPRYTWMPELSEQAPPVAPLSVAEALQLQSLLATATSMRTARRHQHLPSMHDVPNTDDVAVEVASIKQADQMEDGEDSLVRALGRIDPQSFAAVEEQLERAATALHQLDVAGSATDWDPEDWRSRALLDLLARRNKALWSHLAATTAQARIEAEAAITRQGVHEVQIPDLPPEDLPRALTDATKAWADLQASPKLLRNLPTRARRAAAWLLTACTVDARPPETAHDVRLIVERLKAERAVAAVVREWAQVGVADVRGALPVRLSQLADQVADMKHIEAFGAARDAIDTLLVQQRLRIPVSTAQAWDDLCRAVVAARSHIAAARAVKALEAMEQRLVQLSTGSEPIPELDAARRALRERDDGAYERAMAALRGAHQQREEQRTCDALLERLRAAHPRLAARLEDSAADPQWPDRLAGLPEAWAWARAGAYCERQRRPGRDQQLQGELDDTESRHRAVTADLAAEHAWLHCLSRMKQEQRQALQAYKSNVGAYGKGTGRYAPRYRRAAREAMVIAQDAVPAWVMPLSQVAETIPPRPDSFDVIIVDEASQVGIDALFLLWLAPRVIIVGDDKQCAPGSMRREEWQKVFDRLDTLLGDVPAAFRSGFEPQSNLYELLSARFPQVIRLTEHFRCMPEIIGWSSKQFYDNRLDPLRQFGTDRLDPLQVVFVEGAYPEGRDTNIRNPIEAKHIVERLHELLDDPAYVGKTIGVIALQGTGQVRLIESMIVEGIDPAIREQRDLQVGTPPQFQGDQRDVILLSMVITTPGRALTSRDDQRRFNVAASRARDQMLLFTSVRPDQLKTIDLRRSLLGYMQNPPSWQEPVPELEDVQEDVPQRPFDSLFEQRVFLRLRQRGYHVIPQYPANDRRIDLVVVGAGGRLAVECDGRAWHTSPEQVEEDLERERELRRLGWRFWRIRESEFCFDPDRALQPLWKELDRRGIKPGPPPNDTGQGRTSDWSPIDLPDDDDELPPDTSLG